MAKVITSSVKYSGGAQVSRPGVHAKSKTSRLKLLSITKNLTEDKVDNFIFTIF
jgi:hypothetical protein